MIPVMFGLDCRTYRYLTHIFELHVNQIKDRNRDLYPNNKAKCPENDLEPIGVT